MSKFLFKGVSIDKVINTTSGTTTATGYGFTYNTTTIANSKPLLTGYLVKGVDIANNAAAPLSPTYSKTETVTVPTGAKSFRFIGRGGGGGGGSGGGGALSTDGPDSWQDGGNGGPGGVGGYVYTSANVDGANTLIITIGGGGAGAQPVGSRSQAPNGDADAGEGTQGTHGGETFFNINNTKSDVAPGGVGGNGGTGGYAPGPGTTPNNDRPKAANGNIGSNFQNQVLANWDNTAIIGIANGGTGGAGGGAVGSDQGPPSNPNYAFIGSVGNAGNAGAAQIIWLYG